MKIYNTSIEDLKIIEPKIFNDSRGIFFESFNKEKFCRLLGKNIDFVQDNQSHSKKNVLRGIHLQKSPHSQGKLVRVVSGSVLDYAIDLRKDSKTYLKYFSLELNTENNLQLWIPEGFGHAFLALTDNATVHYKTSNFYNKDSELTIRWDDPKININWPIDLSELIISDKDKAGIYL
ncbi:MAG: dTDP-4-dehydrorhamnose 3,5-epimerase [Candidatus Marinimicrobia bacterium]|nr:dTDP-4-dehydrorhamnose 3,5-epimerase [Candidatus Neomarinimicrobiota bacterium]|tara:strand:+ start:180 stop:710 length:531 start_codon:yes stop_codon:yes gene_type:complete